MIQHVALFKWNDDVTDAHVTAAAAALDELREVIPEIASYRHGRDAGINQGNFDYAVVADFATDDDYLVYRDHPAHKAFIAAYITGHLAQRCAVQFRSDG